MVDQTIQEVNKKGIVAVINGKMEAPDDSDEMFNILLECVLYYPPNLLQNTLALVPSDQMTLYHIEKSMKIRCSLALKPNGSLKWLNDLFDFDMVEPQINYYLKSRFDVYEKQKNHTECAQWIYDLLGRIEAAIGNHCTGEHLLFLIDILAMSLVGFSGFHMFIKSSFEFEEYIMLLPQATAVLLDSKDWCNISEKVMECFYHLNSTKELLPQFYQKIFGQTLQALRHHPEFKKNNKWMKYLNCSIILGTNL
ncbi:hypothetical protein HHI36_002051 [Cryptolaemus montrouzieri]